MEVVMTKKKSNVRSWIAAAFSLTSMAGCADKAVDIGDDTEPAVLGASLSDYEGTWVGYVELGEWDDGTQTVRLVLDENGNGVIEFGEADPLPAPDPEAGFPPNLPVHPMAGVELPTGVVSGFSYPIEGALVESKRIRLGSSHRELFRAWCELLEPVANPNILDTGYACLSSWALSDGTTCTLEGTGETVDCGFSGCLDACQCDEVSCEVSGIHEDIRMDAQLEAEGAELEGSFDVPQGRYRIVMEREAD
jgi:hypothetical protein